jgi:nucleotide-binding universal stress UspA family protein
MGTQRPLFRSFLVPLDGSHLAESVLPLVERLAAAFAGKVRLLHIMEQHAPSSIHGERHLTSSVEAEAYLMTVAARLHRAGIAVETHVHGAREGDVARSIVEHTQELDSDIVVLCTHGGGGLRELLFGSIAQQVLQRGTRPILLIPPSATKHPPAFSLRQLLVPLDGTPAHEQALPAASAIAHVCSAVMRLVLVIPTLTTLSGERAVPGLLLPITMTAILDLAQQGGAEYLEHIAAAYRTEGLSVSVEVARGDPVPTVLDLADRHETDLIVMASHGRAGIEALLSGSVAPRIAGRTGHPLLLLRAVEATHDPR